MPFLAGLVKYNLSELQRLARDNGINSSGTKERIIRKLLDRGIESLLPNYLKVVPEIPRTEKIIFHEIFQADDLYYQVWERTKTTWVAKEGVARWVIRGELRPYKERPLLAVGEEEDPRRGLYKSSMSLSQGYIYYDIYPDTKTARILEIMAGVKGLGSRLVNLVEKRMKLYGITTIGGSSVEPARGFWAKMGFKLEDGEMDKFLAKP